MKTSTVFKYAVAVGAGIEVGRAIKPLVNSFVLGVAKKVCPDAYDKAIDAAIKKVSNEKVEEPKGEEE